MGPMEFPKPTIDLERAGHELQTELQRSVASCNTDGFHTMLRALLAQSWEEGRWSPPGSCLNPYGEPAERPATDPQEEWPTGEPLRQLRLAARAALAWVENMAPTVRRTALANQLRDALGGK